METQTVSTFAEVALEIEKVLGESITESFAHDEPEDVITFSLVRQLQNILADRSIAGIQEFYKIHCETAKLKGKAEELHGDIAFVVRQKKIDGSVITGVGFLEAKIRNQQTGRFDAFKLNQIKRQLSRSPLLFVLPYDYESPSTAYPSMAIPYSSFCRECNDLDFKFSRACAIPAEIVLRHRRLDTSLYRFSLPIGYQIALRFLRGFDLHYAPLTGDRIETFLENLPARYVLDVTIGETEGHQHNELLGGIPPSLQGWIDTEETDADNDDDIENGLTAGI